MTTEDSLPSAEDENYRLGYEACHKASQEKIQELQRALAEFRSTAKERQEAKFFADWRTAVSSAADEKAMVDDGWLRPVDAARLKGALTSAIDREQEAASKALAAEKLLRRTVQGGSIVSTAKLSSVHIAVANVCGHVLVVDDGLGFVYIPSSPDVDATAQHLSDIDVLRDCCHKDAAEFAKIRDACRGVGIHDLADQFEAEAKRVTQVMMATSRYATKEVDDD